MVELGPVGQALMSGVLAMKEKKKTDEESHGLLSAQTSNVSLSLALTHLPHLPLFY